MKYMQTGGFQHNRFMRWTLGFTFFFVAALWVSNFAMYFTRMGLTPASVERYYRGSEAEFQPARSAASMLETTHTHLPIIAVVVLILTHLAIFAPLSDRAKGLVIASAFGSAFLSELAGWLVRFVHPGFAWLKIASFLVFQGVIAFLLAVLAAFLVQAAREGAPLRRLKKLPETDLV